MPLHMTKVAYEAKSMEDVRAWFDDPTREMLLTTRYLPKRHEEMVGGSLYWIHAHALIGRSPILGFEQREDGRWHVRLERVLIEVHPKPKRAHQGWRYLTDRQAPLDLAPGEVAGDAVPVKMMRELAKLGLA